MSQSELTADEYHFIGNIVRKQTKYGSTVNSNFKEPRYIEHKLQPSDTLQGLALKYNVSMERIKRANNLWTSDSLFSRSALNIPIISDHGTSSSSSLSSPSSSLVYNNGFISTTNRRSLESNENNGTQLNSSRSYAYVDGISELRCDDVFLEEDDVSSETPSQSTASLSSSSTNGASLSESTSRSSVNKINKRRDKTVKENVCNASQNNSNDYNGNGTLDSHGADEEGKEESVADFLIRIDCYIAKSKNQVNSIMRHGCKLSNTYSDDDLFKTSIGQQQANASSSGSSSSYLRRQNSARNGVVSYSGLRAAANESSPDLPQPLVMTQGRKVMSSLKRLEQQQDEMFEL